MTRPRPPLCVLPQEGVPQLLERHRAVLHKNFPVDDHGGTGRVRPGTVLRRGLLHDRDLGAEFGLRTGGGLKVLLSPLAHRSVVVERDDRSRHGNLLCFAGLLQLVLRPECTKSPPPPFARGGELQQARFARGGELQQARFARGGMN